MANILKVNSKILFLSNILAPFAHKMDWFET